MSTKSYADQETLSLFREADKRVRLRTLIGGTPFRSSWVTLDQAESAVRRDADGRLTATLPTGATWELLEEEIEQEEGAAPPFIPIGEAILDTEQEFDGHAYIASVAEIRDRLDAMGFTPRAAEQVLARYVAEQLAEIGALLDEDRSAYVFYTHDRDVLAELTFDKWLEAFRWLKQRGAHRVDERGEYAESSWGGYFVPASEATPLLKYLLDDDSENKYGFPYDALRFLYRAALEVCPSDSEVMLDLSDVTSGGYYTEVQPVVDEARADQIALYPALAPTIILTEGSTDQRALQGALHLLYPHLTDLYSFMDFDAMRVRGGAPALVAAVKSFAAAGIANRVIALFDNDTAAHSALRELREVQLPATMRVLTYPPLALAAAYPTIGPVGEHVADINGSAASLEMYFGEDVLRDEQGVLTPVRWTSIDASLQRYQGELRNKPRLQARFAEKLTAAQRDPARVVSQDWAGMKAILDAVRKAFY
jgi:hypothetical protein